MGVVFVLTAFAVRFDHGPLVAGALRAHLHLGLNAARAGLLFSIGCVLAEPYLREPSRRWGVLLVISITG